MTTTATEPVLTACPPWCREHSPSDREGNVGDHARTIKGERWEVRITVWFNHDGSENDRDVFVTVDDEGLTPEQAGALARDLAYARDLLTPAGPDAFRLLQVAADAMGATLEVPEQATEADAREAGLRLGEQIGRRS